jgi:hypothetical protein
MPTSVELPEYQLAALFNIAPGNDEPIQKISDDTRAFLIMRGMLEQHPVETDKHVPTIKMYEYRAQIIDEYGLDALLPLAPNVYLRAPLILENEGLRPAMKDTYGKWATEGYDMRGGPRDGSIRVGWKFPHAWTAIGDPDRHESDDLYFRQTRPLGRALVLLTKHGFRVTTGAIGQIGREFLTATPTAAIQEN